MTDVPFVPLGCLSYLVTFKDTGILCLGSAPRSCSARTYRGQVEKQNSIIFRKTDSYWKSLGKQTRQVRSENNISLWMKCYKNSKGVQTDLRKPLYNTLANFLCDYVFIDTYRYMYMYTDIHTFTYMHKHTYIKNSFENFSIDKNIYYYHSILKYTYFQKLFDKFNTAWFSKP